MLCIYLEGRCTRRVKAFEHKRGKLGPRKHIFVKGRVILDITWAVASAYFPEFSLRVSFVFFSLWCWQSPALSADIKNRLCAVELWLPEYTKYITPVFMEGAYVRIPRSRVLRGIDITRVTWLSASIKYYWKHAWRWIHSISNSVRDKLFTERLVFS